MALPATDDFERADSGSLGANWTANTAETGTLGISTGRAAPNSGPDDACSVWNADTWPQDHYSQTTISASADYGVGAGVGPTCRTLTAAKTCYRLVANLIGYELMKFTAGTGSSLSSGSGTTVTTADVLRLEATGSSTTTLRMYKNGVQFGGDIVDSSSALTTGGAGIAYSSIDGATRIAAWEGGSLGGGGGVETSIAWITA